MSWVALLSALLKAFSVIYDWVRTRELMDAGEDRQIAKALAEQLRKSEYVKKKLEEAKHMSDAELAERLRELEPGETNGK